MITTLFVVFAFASSVLGDCPVSPIASGVDFNKIAGRWYVIAGPGSDKFPVNYRCMVLDFTPREEGNYNLTLRGTNTDGSLEGDYYMAERTSKNGLDISLIALYPPTYFKYPITFYVADTNYDNYLAIYTCWSDDRSSKLESALILSRTNTMSAGKFAELADLLIDKVGISSDDFESTIQKDCEYWSYIP